MFEMTAILAGLGMILVLAVIPGSGGFFATAPGDGNDCRVGRAAAH